MEPKLETGTEPSTRRYFYLDDNGFIQFGTPKTTKLPGIRDMQRKRLMNFLDRITPKTSDHSETSAKRIKLEQEASGRETLLTIKTEKDDEALPLVANDSSSVKVEKDDSEIAPKIKLESEASEESVSRVKTENDDQTLSLPATNLEAVKTETDDSGIALKLKLEPDVSEASLSRVKTENPDETLPSANNLSKVKTERDVDIAVGSSLENTLLLGDRKQATRSIEDSIRELLTTKFGHRNLLPGQLVAMKHIMCQSEEDTIIVRNPQDGKSLCFVIPACLDEKGFTVVFSLSRQYAAYKTEELSNNGVLAYNISNQTKKLDPLFFNDDLLKKIRIVFCEIDTFLQKNPQQKHQPHHAYKFLAQNCSMINRFVISDAHGCSRKTAQCQWSFNELIRKLREPIFAHKRIVALSSTFDQRVVQDIPIQLGSKMWRIFFSSNNQFFYNHIKHGVFEKHPTAWHYFLAYLILSSNIKQQGLIYCASASESTIVTKMLREMGIRVSGFSSKLTIDMWLNNEIDFITVERAFDYNKFPLTGMNCVIHFSPPSSMSELRLRCARMIGPGEKRSVILYDSQYSANNFIFFPEEYQEVRQFCENILIR